MFKPVLSKMIIAKKSPIIEGTPQQNCMENNFGKYFDFVRSRLEGILNNISMKGPKRTLMRVEMYDLNNPRVVMRNPNPKMWKNM